MFHSRTHSFSRTLVAGGLLSLVVGVVDTLAGPSAVTAFQQAPAAAQPAQPAPEAQPTPDGEMAAKIRKAIADDKALAPYAQTLKVIVNDGLVALKGSVKSEADKKAIGDKADKIAGEKNVMNNLVVAAEN
jgi:hyperosmotically inducible periplasmic protein